MGTFNPCTFNENVFNTGGSCGAVCTNIITEDDILFITQSSLELVTEDSVCPSGAVTGDIDIFIGFPTHWMSGEPINIGG